MSTQTQRNCLFKVKTAYCVSVCVYVCMRFVLSFHCSSIYNSGICGDANILYAIKGDDKSSYVCCVPFHHTKHISSSSSKYWIKFNKEIKTNTLNLELWISFQFKLFLPRLNYSTRFVFMKPTQAFHSPHTFHKVNENSSFSLFLSLSEP